MRRVWIGTVWALVWLAWMSATAPAAVRVRLPAAPGSLYPATAESLRAAVELYTNQVEAPAVPGRMAACLVPAGGFPACGQAMAHAFAFVREGAYDRVIVITPTHVADFTGLSLPAVQAFRTPLGDVPLDGPAMRELAETSGIALRSVNYRDRAYNNPHINRTPLHELEYGYEVALPFLQTRLGSFKLIPVVVGSLPAVDEAFDEKAIDGFVEALRGIKTPKTLIVLAANLTHFGNVFGFRPFEDNIPERIAALDFDLIDVIKTRRIAVLSDYMRQTGNRVPGAAAFALFMRLLPRDAIALLLDYRVSGAANGSYDASISYATMGFFVPSLRNEEAPAPQAASANIPGEERTPEGDRHGTR